MRSTIRFLAAAGLALAAVPAGAASGAGVPQDAYVGSHWDEAPHAGTLSTAGSAAVAQTGLPDDAYVGSHWSDDPSARSLPARPSPARPSQAATPDPRSSTCSCPCLAGAR
jgi:hypothetical protein